MSENTTSSSIEVIVNPATGEALDLGGSTTDLAAAVAGIGAVRAMLDDYRQAVENEIARRMDTANSRTERVGDWKITVNAPTTETYPIDQVREILDGFIEDGTLDPVVRDRVLVTAPPKPPEQRVAKTELNKLLKHPNEDVADTFGAARIVAPARRSVRIEKLS